MWQESSVSQMLFGSGLDHLKEYLGFSYGLEISSHNGFIDALVVGGAFGLILYCLFMGSLVWFIQNRRESEYYSLALAGVFCTFTSQLTQGGAGFTFDLLLSLTLANLFLERQSSGSNRPKAR
jgi:hypothetical protein